MCRNATATGSSGGKNLPPESNSLACPSSFASLLYSGVGGVARSIHPTQLSNVATSSCRGSRFVSINLGAGRGSFLCFASADYLRKISPDDFRVGLVGRSFEHFDSSSSDLVLDVLLRNSPENPPNMPIHRQNIDSTASAQRDRLVGVVRVKTTAPTVDAAAVEAKLQQFADLRKIDQTASKVRVVSVRVWSIRYLPFPLTRKLSFFFVIRCAPCSPRSTPSAPRSAPCTPTSIRSPRSSTIRCSASTKSPRSTSASSSLRARFVAASFCF